MDADLSPNGRAALWYAHSVSVPVVPMTYPVFREDGTVECSCGNPRGETDHHLKAGKHPAVLPGFRHGRKDATRDLAKITTTWQRDPNLGIQIPTGAETGYVVIDVDNEDSWRVVEDSIPIPDTLMSLSGRGHHLWFKHPGHHVKTITNTAFGPDLPGIDVKGENGAITAPPSLHYSGLEYQWVKVNGKLIPPADWPPILSELMQPVRPERPARPRRDFTDSRSPGDAYAAKALDEEVAQVLGTPAGGRNDQLNASAFNVGQLIHQGLLDHDDAFNALLDAAHSIGLSTGDAIPTIRSGFRGGAQKPRNRGAA